MIKIKTEENAVQENKWLKSKKIMKERNTILIYTCST